MPSTLVPLLIKGFPKFLSAFDKYCPFTRTGQLEYHVTTIQLRRRLGSAIAAIESSEFRRSLYYTLQAWQIGSRASRIKPFADFESALLARREEIGALEGACIESNLDGRLKTLLCTLIADLDIVNNDARLVPNSKAVHHILPDLVVPIDRAYTQRFFQWPTPKFQYQNDKCFIEAFDAFRQIAKAVDLPSYVGSGWYTSTTKVIDNAIVGLWRLLDIETDRGVPLETVLSKVGLTSSRKDGNANLVN